MDGRKNENKKIRKKIQRTILILRLKFSEKNFYKKNRVTTAWLLARQKGAWSIIAHNKQIQAQNGRIAFILHGFLLMIRAYNVKKAFLPLFCALSAFFCFFLMDIANAAKIRAKIWLFVRGAAARFLFMSFARRFVFRLCVSCYFFFLFIVFLFRFSLFSLFSFLAVLSFRLWHLSFFVCVVISFSFSFSFAFLLFVVCCLVFSFFSCLLFVLSNNNNNNKYILYYFVCVCVCVRARTRQRRGKKQGTKKGGFFAALCLLSKNLLKCKSRFCLFSTRLPRLASRRGASLPRLFRRR